MAAYPSRSWTACDQCSKVGAEVARPSSDRRPKKSMWRTTTSRVRCLVNGSAGLSAPATLADRKSPHFRRSWTHRSKTWRCLIFPRPLRRQMPIAAVASVRISIFKEMPRPDARDWRPSAIQSPRQMLLSSASLRVSAMAVWVSGQ